MKRLLYNIGGSLVLVFIISSAFYYIVAAGLKKTSRDTIGKFNYILSDTTYYNTLFAGPSTSHLGINPMLFDSITGHQTNSFNASLDGITILETNVIIKKYVKSHHPPKTLYINFVSESLVPDKVWYFPQFFPYQQDTDFSSLVNCEPRLLYGKYLPPLAVTYFDDPLKSLGIFGVLHSKPDYTALVSQKGFLCVERQIQDSMPLEDTYIGATPTGWKILNEVVEYCQQQKIAVRFLITPTYNVKLHPSSVPVIDKLKEYGNAHGIRTIDLLTDSRFANPNLFADRLHLNAPGAQLLTSILAEDYNLTK